MMLWCRVDCHGGMMAGGDLFERGVAGAFADAVDGALDLAGSGFDASEVVGYSQAEVVVAVGGEDDVFDAGDAGADHEEDGCA